MEPKLGIGAAQVIAKYGGQGRNRTADASLFRAALYQLSYLATERESLVMGCCGKRIITTQNAIPPILPAKC
jgi:hypothetical protein